MKCSINGGLLWVSIKLFTFEIQKCSQILCLFSYAGSHINIVCMCIVHGLCVLVYVHACVHMCVCVCVCMCVCVFV